MARYIPCTERITADELADLLACEVFDKYGVPLGIVSDRGAVFTSDFWRTFCWNLKVRRRLSTAYHPQTDGETERQNQTLEHYLRVYAGSRQDNWAGLLSAAEFAYNNSMHSTTGMPPFQAYTGTKPSYREPVEGNRPEGEVPIVS